MLKLVGLEWIPTHDRSACSGLRFKKRQPMGNIVLGSRRKGYLGQLKQCLSNLVEGFVLLKLELSSWQGRLKAPMNDNDALADA